jgi:vacuolar-type H+-ATPase subunit E/Vma4
MIAVFRPKDLTRSRRRAIENALNDISPELRDGVVDLLTSWEGATSEQRLKEMLGQERTRLLLDQIAKKARKLKGEHAT